MHRLRVLAVCRHRCLLRSRDEEKISRKTTAGEGKSENALEFLFTVKLYLNLNKKLMKGAQIAQ